MEKRGELAEILEGTRMFDNKEDIIQKVILLPDITENFLISLIKSDFREIIPFIYESTSALLKLTDAGFETDPRKIDSTRKSALFYALKSEKSELVFLLYDHAANACLQTEASVRFPDSVIVDNLLCLKDDLKLLKNDLESEEISKTSRYMLRDLSRFNEFQIEICKRISDIRCRIKNYNGTVKEREVIGRKEIILAILKTYEIYFDSINGELPKDADDISRFKEFFEHENYFDKLDFSSALTFFDNLFLLKERLLLPNSSYLDVESTFFLYIFCRKYLIDNLFKRHKKQKNFHFVSRWITFEKRLSLQNQICNFQEILDKTGLSENTNIIDKVPNEAVRTLINLPEIYGHFLVFRLQHYLNAATGIVVEDLKSFLVIERSLQVIGECCKDSDFMSVQKILTLGLPSDFITHTKQIRNRFAHIKSHELQCKFNLEQDVGLFKGIQNELVKLSQFLLPIYSFHKYEMDKFLLLRLKESVDKARKRKISKEHENKLKAILASPEREENEMLAHTQTDSCQSRWNHIFDDMYKSLREEIDDLDYSGNILDQNTASVYNSIVQNIISFVEKKLKSLTDPISKDDAKELDSHFWSLEKILTCLTTDQKLAKTRQKKDKEKLTSMLEERRLLFSNLLKSSMQSQKTNNTSSDRISDEENKIAEMHLSSEPEDAYNNNQRAVDPFFTYKKHAVIIKPIRSTFSNETVDNGDSLLANSCHSSEAEGPAETIVVKKETFAKEAALLLRDYRDIAKLIFEKFSYDSCEIFDFRNIEKYCWILKGHKILNEKEKEQILQSVPKQFQNASELKRRLIILIAQDSKLTKEISEELPNLNLKNKEIKEIINKIESGLIFKAIPIICSAKDYFLELKNKIDLKEIKVKEYDFLIEKLKLPKNAQGILLNIVRGKNKRNPCDRFKFLLDGIKKLKKILIEEHKPIQQLWITATTRRKKMLVKEQILQLYLNDSAIQASVETLLFDCMAILDNYELDKLWRKTTNLFSGINLRNVLAHGHPLLESLGRLLDPSDLPSELVEKMLKLISDEYVICCIQQILEQTETNRKDFMAILEDERLRHLAEPIRNCPHYSDYASLIEMRDDCHREKVVSP